MRTEEFVVPHLCCGCTTTACQCDCCCGLRTSKRDDRSADPTTPPTTLPAGTTDEKGARDE